MAGPAICIRAPIMTFCSPTPCRKTACGRLVYDLSGYCAKHQRAIEGRFADKNRGDRHSRGYGSLWDKLRAEVILRDAGLCQACLTIGVINAVAGKKFQAHVDHIVPKAAGGTDELANLQLLCAPHHKAKTQRESKPGAAAKQGGIKRSGAFSTVPAEGESLTQHQFLNRGGV